MNSQEEKWFKRLNEKKISHAKVFMEPEYRRWWTAVIDKYPDSAHFIYELLQNADDAKATTADIYLTKSGVLFKHNGTIRFTVSDPDNYEEDIVKGQLGHLNSITSIGMSTKTEGSTDNKIGKFGVGFKAVFQFTKTPEIYDDNVCFRLRNYIIPELIDQDHPWRKKGETLFYLPFDSDKLPASKAYNIIESKLKTLNSPILFLNHLKEISWSSEDDNVKGIYLKEVEKYQKIGDIVCKNIIVKSLGDALTEDNLWLFTRDVVVEDGIHPISVGYYIDDKGKIDTQRRPKIFCYFPTSESLGFCFVMHAPFALVDNRQQIKREEEVNTDLFNELSILAAKALVLLCELSEKQKKQWIDENIFEIAPLTEREGDDDEDQDKWYNCFYKSFQDALENKPVHLSTEKKYVKADNAYRVDESIRQLLSVEQFNKLIKSSHLSYVHTKLKKNDEIDDYLDEIGIETYTVDDFGRDFSESFIDVQQEEWLMKFYRFLLTDPARRLIEKYKLNLYRSTSAPLLTKPFIRNSKKRFVAPFTVDGKPNVFINDGTTQMDGVYYVDSVLASDVDFQKLLKKLNITVPDGRSYVENSVLPRYAERGCLYDDDQYRKDFRFIYEVYQKCNAQEIDNYLALLKKSFKFKCTNNHFHRIEDIIYEKNERTLILTDLVETIHIIDRDFYRRIGGIKEGYCDSFLDRFNFNTHLKIVETKDVDNFEILKRIPGGSIYEYGSPRFTDYLLDTFDECCKRGSVSEEYSVFVWESLYYQIKTANRWMMGDGTYQPFNDGRYKRKTCSFESSLSISLKNNKWLYNKNGQLCKPNRVYIEDLSSKYTVSEAMINLIGLKHSPLTQDDKFIEENCSKATVDATRLGRAAQDAGIKTPEELARLVEIRDEIKKKEEAELRAAERKKQEEEERKKLLSLQSESEEPLFTHKQNEYSVEETFDRTVSTQPSKPKNPETSSPVDFDLVVKQMQEQEAEKNRLLQIAKDENKRYTYEWFLALLEMEFSASGEENRGKRGIEINFYRVEKDPYSEHGVLLKNPSRHIPIAIEEMNNIAVTFRLPEDTHQTIVFEVASVQDYVLRLKCKNEDIETIDTLMSLSSKIYRAELKTEKPIQLIAKLQDAFFDLQLPDEYSMLENINPTIKFIFGPPGTGKTTHLVKKWINQIATKPRGKMLVLCPTNKAADVIA